MAETQHFAMEAFVWEVQYTDKEGVHALQNRMSRLTNDRLINEISERLEKIIPSTEQINFDRLELDLGTVLPQDIETELPGRLMDALTEQIKQYLEIQRKKTQQDTEENDQYHSEDSIESLFIQLLETGLLPWWAVAGQRKELTGLVSELLDRDKARLAAILRKTGVQEPVRRRLAYQLPETLLQQIIQLLEPTESAYIIGYHREVVKIQQQEQPVKTEAAGFSRALWYFILQYLLDDRGSEFNRKAFAERTLRQIAANYSINYFELLKLLYAAVREAIEETSRAISLEKLLEQLAIEASVYVQDPLQPELIDIPGNMQDSEAVVLLQQLNLIAYFLQFGSLPPGTASYSNDDLSAMVVRLAVTIPQHFIGMLRQVWSKSDFSERYLRLLGREKIKEVFGSIEQKILDAIWQVSSLLDVFDRQYHLFENTGVEWRSLRWKLLLHTFLTAVDDELSEQETIGIFLQTFAAQTSQSYISLLNTIQQKIQETFRFGIHDSRLPQWIDALEPGQPIAEKEIIPFEVEQETALLATGYLDILYFVVEFGYMPWWAAASLKEKKLENWLSSSVETAPISVKKLLEWAGLSPLYRERLVQVLSVEVLMQWLELLPQGRTLVKRAVSLLRFVENYFQTSGPATAKRILQAFWEDLVWNGYQYFRTPAVFSLALQKIARDRGQTWQSLVLSISSTLDDSLTGSVEDAVYVQTLQRLALAAWDIAGSASQNEEAVSQPGIWQHPGFQKRFQMFFSSEGALKDIEQITPPEILEENALLNYLQQANPLLRSRMGEVSNFLLQYYLIWGKLPDEFRSAMDGQQDIFIRQLLLLAFTADRNNLRILLSDTRFSTFAIETLKSHITEDRGGIDKQITDWLADTIKEQEVFLPIPLSVSPGVTPGGIREELVKWMASDGVLTDATLHNRVRQILDEFFSTGQLPQNWPSDMTGNPSGRLAALLLLLFNENRQMLHHLLQQPYHLPAARIWLQELLRNEADSSVRQLLAFMEPYQSIYWSKQMSTEGGVTGSQQEILEKLTPEEWTAQLASFLRADPGFDTNPDENTLRILLRLLYRHDETALLTMLQSMDTRQPARLRLYDILEGTTDRLEQKMYAGWQQLRDEDMTGLTSEYEAVPADTAEIPSSVSWTLQQVESKGIDFLYALLKHSAVHWQQEETSFFRQMELLLTNNISDIFFQQYIRKIYYSFLAEMAVGKVEVYSREDFFRKYIAFFFRRNTGLPEQFLQKWVNDIDGRDAHDYKIESNEKEYFVALVRDRLQKKRIEEGRGAAKAENMPVTGTEESIQQEIDQHLAREEALSSDKNESDKREPQHKIYIRNAGLVLLHPFLNTYFTRLGLVADGNFVSETARFRGVMLLYYLVFGRADAEEHELPLNKLLCGVRIMDPVPLVFEPTEEEQTLTEELFQVIFQRWEKMKNSSVAGFRASFLQREGALNMEEETWNLRVEQRAYDLLLDTLPWAFGMIKLPWMEKILTVVWT